MKVREVSASDEAEAQTELSSLRRDATLATAEEACVNSGGWSVPLGKCFLCIANADWRGGDDTWWRWELSTMRKFAQREFI